MDFSARLSRVNSRPSRTDDSKFVTVVMLECHDLREAGMITGWLGQNVEVRLEPIATPLTPMERAINNTLEATPVVGGSAAPVEDEESVEKPTPNGNVHALATPAGRRRTR